MKQFIEFLPIIIFGISYFYTKDVFFATKLLIVCLFFQACIEYFFWKSISRKTIIVFCLSLFFGGSTLIFRNEEFLFWRPTVINWFFSLSLFCFEMFSRKNLLKITIGKSLLLPDNAWKTLSRGWSLGFFFSGLLNILIAYNFSLDFWISYKIFGGLFITTAYVVITVIYLWTKGYLK